MEAGTVLETGFQMLRSVGCWRSRSMSRGASLTSSQAMRVTRL